MRRMIILSFSPLRVTNMEGKKILVDESGVFDYLRNDPAKNCTKHDQEAFSAC
jgi:hypothetical protein